MDRLLYPTKEAFRIAGLGRTKGFQEIKEGRLLAVRAGGKTLIPASALQAYADRLIAEAQERSKPKRAA